VLFRNNPNDVFSSLSIGLRKNIEMSIKPPSNIIEEKDWGGFQESEKNAIDSILTSDDKRLKVLKDTKIESQISQVNIEYLKKIIQYCKAHNVEPFLIRTPTHERYHYLDNEKLFDSIRNRHFKTIAFLDFKSYPILNSQFADDSHLNFKGAIELSKTLETLLKDGLLESKKPQQMIDEVISDNRYQRENMYRFNYGYDPKYTETIN
jgi:hypothetical protein